MTKLITLLALAACGGSPAPGSTSPSRPPSTEAPARLPSERYPGRKRLVRATPAELAWQDAPRTNGVSTAVAWGDPSTQGGWFIKLAQDTATTQTYGALARGVVVAGTLETNTEPVPNSRISTLSPGYTWFQPVNTPWTLTCASEECIVFVETMRKMDGDDGEAKRVYVVGGPPGDVTDTERWSVTTVWGLRDLPRLAKRDQGMLMMLMPGQTRAWHIHRYDHHGVVLAGTIDNVEPGHKPKDLPVGSYYFQRGGHKHTTHCKAGGPKCVVYLHFMGRYDDEEIPTPPPAGSGPVI